MKKMSKELTKNVDKMARHLDKKMNDVKEVIEESQKSNLELTIIILQSQLEDLVHEEELLEESVNLLR